ncbi:MAG TPA: asparagine synthase (glutamine-hydrolyzing) [Bryobacteraceae bacterium]|jgi:asparagine synthase (glutamine-hydrolysing)
MCGIAGILSCGGQPVLERELLDMSAALIHRGPDDEGVHVSPEAGLCMRRLSIIDLASGHQPVANEDRSVWVVLNGEIYNFKEQRRLLQAKGHVFSTATDTEVIVHLYEEYETRCVDHLRGMFAFALWDERQKQLLLARDRIGIKPLYYTVADGRLLFASELKAILQLPEVERRLNWSAVAHYFAFLTTPSDESIIDGVCKLEPGHILLASPERPYKIRRYWDLKFEPDYSRPEDYFIGRTRELIDESVRLHMIADVPVGAFLSGGIDSSAVVAAASKLTNQPLQTFSIGFSEAEYNEIEYARLVAKDCGADFHELILGPDTLENLDNFAWHMDEPFGDSSAIPTNIVSGLAAQSVKVVLSGDGGDELFAGYDKYVVEERERQLAFSLAPVRTVMGGISRALPHGVRGRNLLRHYSLTGAERYLDACTFFRLDETRKLFQPEFGHLLAQHDPWRARKTYLNARNDHWLSRLQAMDIQHYLPLDILTKVDRMSMAHSIEARVPLLDHKLVEFAATIPPEFHMRGGTTKYILKRALDGLVPDQVLNRSKHGFAVPLNYWFRGRLGSYVRDLLLGATSERRGLFNLPVIERLVERHDNGRNLDLQLWTLISFELWARAFLDHAAPRRAAA